MLAACFTVVLSTVRVLGQARPFSSSSKKGQNSKPAAVLIQLLTIQHDFGSAIVMKQKHDAKTSDGWVADLHRPET